jgi:ubiquinone/menaquinone biosynthesis C-methylase UbiE
MMIGAGPGDASRAEPEDKSGFSGAIGMGESKVGSSYTERMVPEQANPRIFWEHIGRYRFARGFARGKRTLDIACGEGYGAASLVKAGASSVVGVDISPEACEQARSKYGLDIRLGNALAIPLPDRSVDLVVSFETIEHVASPSAFVEECTRVLDPGGTLIISTPNRPIYSPEGTSNPFHQVELDEGEFLELLRSQFQTVRLFSQFPESADWWSFRSLSAEKSPWLKIKGFWRLSTWICPELRPDLTRETRARAVDLIQRRHTFPASLFNPYVVRLRPAGSRERPYILIAVAQGVKPV